MGIIIFPNDRRVIPPVARFVNCTFRSFCLVCPSCLCLNSPKCIPRFKIATGIVSVSVWGSRLRISTPSLQATAVLIGSESCQMSKNPLDTIAEGVGGQLVPFQRKVFCKGSLLACHHLASGWTCKSAESAWCLLSESVCYFVLRKQTLFHKRGGI